jgi:hypothetical protein
VVRGFAVFTVRPGIREELEMNSGEERVLAELQSALDALVKASGHLETVSRDTTASGVSPKVAGARGLLKELQQEVSYLMHLTRSKG